jgi:hypothetical protein
MLEEWHDFYLLIGGAAGAMIGLLFVVVSIAAGVGKERGRRLFLSPVVFHLSVVLGIGGMAMVPREPLAATAILAGGAALAGLAYMAWVARALFTGESTEVPHWTDPWWYGAAPAAAYAAMLLAAVLVALRPPMGLVLLAAAQGALVAVSVRNAWDLITWIAPRAKNDSKGNG